MIEPRRDFCLIRHGQTDANRDGIIAGRIEAQLTAQGRSDARALADMRWPLPIALFSSPQDRARATAALAFPAHRARIVAELRERNWGIHEGRPLAELPLRTVTPPGGEGWAEMVQRVGGALSACITLAEEALPVIVCHSGVIRAARTLMGLDFAGPSAPNATPLLYTALAGGWHEQTLPPVRSSHDLRDL